MKGEGGTEALEEKFDTQKKSDTNKGEKIVVPNFFSSRNGNLHPRQQNQLKFSH